jgi:hypothetical protein
MPSGHGNGLRPRIRTNGRRNAHEPVNLILDFEHAHVSGHSFGRVGIDAFSPKAFLHRNMQQNLAVRLPSLPIDHMVNAIVQVEADSIP